RLTGRGLGARRHRTAARSTLAPTVRAFELRARPAPVPSRGLRQHLENARQGVRRDRNGVDLGLREKTRELRVVARRLAAQADLAPLFVRALDHELDEPLHAGIRLVEERREDFRVAIDAERELREVVRADRKSVEDLRELFREDHVIRDLAHDVDLELVLSADEAVLGELLDDAAPLVERATEGD